MVKLTENYDSPYNKWKVTTEGDEEGKTIINLGTYEGYLDDIAFFLGDKAFDSLTFKPLSLNIPNNPRSNYVRVKLEVDSKTWDLSPNEVKDYFSKLLKNRNVIVEQGGTFAGVTLKLPEDRRNEMLRQKAHEKLKNAGLTQEEMNALNLDLGGLE